MESHSAKHTPERLQKYLSECGVASRRKAEELIVAGRVQVNGRPAAIGQSIARGKDKILLDGKPVRAPHARLYLALNKPRGYVTTLHDELGRKCVTELLRGVPVRVYPVGRLDRDSEGLLLFTDDGEFANFMMHPRHHVAKVYHVSVRPGVTEAQQRRMAEGIELDGRPTAPAEVRLLNGDATRSTLEVTIYEGRNRQVRRMCEALGLEVARLARVGVGNLRLGSLRPGEWRELAPAEVGSLMRLSGMVARGDEG